MEIYIDCIPCIIRQAIDAARMSTKDEKIHKKIVCEAIKLVENYEDYYCTPQIGQLVHKLVKEYTGIDDPYKNIKKRDIVEAERVVPYLDDFLKEKNNDLYWALKIGATGNNIDSAIYENVDLNRCIDEELEKEFCLEDIDVFKGKLDHAKSILIIGDNAGETSFDKVMIKSMSGLKITYALRSEPIINDATLEDAISSGLDKYAELISSGCNAPGTILQKCDPEFMQLFNSIDIVISKGQGNYEALSDCNRDIFFLLKAKCPMISKRLGVELDSYVFKYHKGSKEGQ